VKLFIGGCPPMMKIADLANLFVDQIRVGNFPQCQLVDVSTHKGFGFIVINKISLANVEANLSTLNLTFGDRTFNVKVAVDRKHSKDDIQRNKNKKLLVTNLTKKITHVELQEYFSKFGKLDRAYVAYDPQTNAHKGFGFIIYEDLEVAQHVMRIQEHVIGDVHVKVNRN
jgi:RNA-binding protein Musashi